MNPESINVNGKTGHRIHNIHKWRVAALSCSEIELHGWK